MGEDKEKIEAEVREMLLKFSRELSVVKTSGSAKSVGVKESSGFRAEKEGEECDDNFRRRVFENAPKKNSDFLIAEKGNW
jgi:hypothetical protein